MQLENIIESILMVATQPLTAEKILQLIDETEFKLKDIKRSLISLQKFYKKRGIELKEVASGFRFQARKDYQQWFHKLLQEKPARYSKALLETLAIVAYRQPVTRADVEAVRGVAVSSSIMKTLQEREWIRVVGQRDIPGKPSIYATTKIFLDYFGLISLGDLPPLSELKDISSLMQQGDKVMAEAADDTLMAMKSKEIVDMDILNNLEAKPTNEIQTTLIQDEDKITDKRHQNEKE